MHFFCPSCWNEISEFDKICKFCNAKIEELDNDNYINKLVRALKHPDKFTVQRAIYILGEKQIPQTLKFIEEILRNSNDPYIKREAILAISKFKNLDAFNIIKKYENNESIIVTITVKDCLNLLEINDFVK